MLAELFQDFCRSPTTSNQSSYKDIKTQPRYLKYVTVSSGLQKAWKSLTVLSCLSSDASRCLLRSSSLAQWVVVACQPFKDFHSTIMSHGGYHWCGEVDFLQDDHGFTEMSVQKMHSHFRPRRRPPHTLLNWAFPWSQCAWKEHPICLRLSIWGRGSPNDLSLPLPRHSGFAKESPANPLSYTHHNPNTVLRWK